MQKLLLAVVLVVLCLGAAIARPSKGGRGPSHRGHRDPADRACRIVAADGVEIASKYCGCDGESQYECSLESTKLGPNGELYTFCYNTQQDFTADQWTGPFAKVCRIDFDKESIEDLERPCPCDGTCSTQAAFTGFQINGESASAFFCEKPDRRGRDDSDGEAVSGDEEGDQAEGDPEPIVQDTCVCLRDAEPRPDKHERPVPCRVIVDGEVVNTKDCGCAGEVRGECSVSKTFTDRRARTVEISFCYQEPAVTDGSRTFTGVLSKACAIRAMDDSEDFHTSTCPCGAECITDDLTTALTGFSVGGVQAKAFFCQRQGRDNDEMDDGEVDEAEEDRSHRGAFGHHQKKGRPETRGEESTCVCLMQEGANCTAEVNRRREEREAERNQCPSDREGKRRSGSARTAVGQGNNPTGGGQGVNPGQPTQRNNRQNGNQRDNSRDRRQGGNQQSDNNPSARRRGDRRGRGSA